VLETHHAGGVKCNSQGQRPWDRLKKDQSPVKDEINLPPHLVWNLDNLLMSPSALIEIKLPEVLAVGPGFCISRPLRFTE